MFEEGQLYSPVTRTEEGVVVHLGKDHPGANDPVYRARRGEIAEAALNWTPGEPAPTIDYTEEEQNVWRTVTRELAPRYERYACRAFREGYAALGLPHDHIPQLEEVSAKLEPLTALRYLPAAGLVPLDVFWFTIEFGVLYEGGELRAYGAGILSSYGEIEEFRSMQIRPIDFLEMGTLEYDITRYQPVLYSAKSMTHLVDELGPFFAGFDDDTPDRLKAEHSVA